MIIEFCKEIIASIAADIDAAADAFSEKVINIFYKIRRKD